MLRNTNTSTERQTNFSKKRRTITGTRTSQRLSWTCFLASILLLTISSATYGDGSNATRSGRGAIAVISSLLFEDEPPATISGITAECQQPGCSVNVSLSNSNFDDAVQIELGSDLVLPYLLNPEERQLSFVIPHGRIGMTTVALRHASGAQSKAAQIEIEPLRLAPGTRPQAVFDAFLENYDGFVEGFASTLEDTTAFNANDRPFFDSIREQMMAIWSNDMTEGERAELAALLENSGMASRFFPRYAAIAVPEAPVATSFASSAATAEQCEPPSVHSDIAIVRSKKCFTATDISSLTACCQGSLESHQIRQRIASLRESELQGQFLKSVSIALSGFAAFPTPASPYFSKGAFIMSLGSLVLTLHDNWVKTRPVVLQAIRVSPSHSVLRYGDETDVLIEGRFGPALDVEAALIYSAFDLIERATEIHAGELTKAGSGDVAEATLGAFFDFKEQMLIRCSIALDRDCAKDGLIVSQPPPATSLWLQLNPATLTEEEEQNVRLEIVVSAPGIVKKRVQPCGVYPQPRHFENT